MEATCIRVQCISGAYFVQNNNRKWIFLQTLNCHKELLTPVLSRVPCFKLKIPKIHLTRENGAVRVVIKCYQAPICFLLSLPWSFTDRQSPMEEPCNMSPKSKNSFERNEGERNMFRHSNLIEGTLEMHFLSSPLGYFCRISSVLRCTHFLQMDAPSRCQRLPHASPSSGNSSQFADLTEK